MKEFDFDELFGEDDECLIAYHDYRLTKQPF